MGREAEAGVARNRVRLRTLGTFSAESGGQALTWLLTHKLASALLVYLAVERETTRDFLLALLWPEQEAHKARHALSQMLYRLRQHLGEEWLEVHGDQLRVTDALHADAVAAATAVERQAWAEALAAYQGPFLSGIYLAGSPEFEEWVERQRARFERLHRRARREYMNERLAAGDRAGAIDVARQWVEQCPLEDEAQHRLIELLADAGERSEALAQFTRYRRLLAAEDLEPLAETVSLAERLRSDGGVGSAGRTDLVHPSAPPPASRGAVPVSWTPAPGSGGAAVLEVGSGLRTRPGSWITGGTALLLVGVLTIAPWRNGSTLPSAPAADGNQADVAVLYFHNLSDSADQYLVDGLTEDLMTVLGGVGRLRVKATSAVKRAQHNYGEDLPAIGRGLGVRYLLEGSFRRTADGVRVSARLVDHESETQGWSRVYDATPTTLLDLPVLIAQGVGDALTGGLHGDEAAAVAKRPTRNSDAYDAFLRGNFFLSRLSPEAAHQEYARAFQLDPSFLAALARDAHVYVMQVDYSFIPPGVTSESLIARALAMIDQVLARDSAVAEAWTARAYALSQLGRYLGARQAAERGVALDPRSVMAQNRLGWILASLGDFAGAARQGRQVLELDPGAYIGYRLLGESSYIRGRYREALAMMDSAVRLSPRDVASRHWRARVRLAAGDVTGARADAAEHDRLVDTVTWLPAYVRAKSGDTEPARSLLADYRRGRAGAFDDEMSMGMALLWLTLGDRARALQVLDNMLSAQSGRYIYNLYTPDFAILANEPRFQALLRSWRARIMVM